MDVKKSCSVTGHRQLKDNQIEFIRQELRREIELAIKEGYTNFMSGFANGADIEYAVIVAELKKDNPIITLEAALPYRKRMNTKNKQFRELLDKCDMITVTSEEYSKSCFQKRNYYMIANSERIIAVFDGRRKGGTFHSIKVAEKNNREIKLINI